MADPRGAAAERQPAEERGEAHVEHAAEGEIRELLGQRESLGRVLEVLRHL